MGETFPSNGTFTATSVPVLQRVETFGISLSEVCGVNNVTVNEGSPFAIFEVGGYEGGIISALTLSSGTGTLGVDTGSTLQYFDGSEWVNYVPGQPITIPNDGDNRPYEPHKLLVRVAIVNDLPLETTNGVGETLTLKANYGFGPEKTGTLTILDDGNGSVFGSANTSGTADVLGTTQDPTVPVGLDDDGARLSIDNVTVNEASPWIVFTVRGQEDVPLTLGALTAGTAVPGLDTAPAFEIYDRAANNGAGAWVPYTPGSPITMPRDGDAAPNETGSKLLVRVAVKQDGIPETSESFTLTVTSGGVTSTGVGTILDDGTGALFGNLNTTGVPDTIGTTADPSLPVVKDDDRPLTVDNTWVYETAGYAVLNVSGEAGQYVTLSPASGSASLGTDTAAASSLEVFNGSAWVAYTPGSRVQIPANGDGSLQVRLAVTADSSSGESPETFTLTATNDSGRAAVGTATILDGANPVPYGPNTNNVSQCWAPVTINVLANDTVITGSLDASSVLLHATAGGPGVTQLSTDFGTYVVNSNGTVTFTPVAKLPNGDYFDGTASVVYYSVKDSTGVRAWPNAIRIGDGSVSDKPRNAILLDGTASLLQSGMWSITGGTLQNRTAKANGGSNLVINGDFTPLGGVIAGEKYGLLTDISHKFSPIPGWLATGGGTKSYGGWGDLTDSTWVGLPEQTGADPSAVYFGNEFWSYRGAVNLNAEGIGLSSSSNPIFIYFPGFPKEEQGDFTSPVKLSQTVENLEVGKKYRLQFWVTGENNAEKYPRPGLAALDIEGYQRLYYRVPANSLNENKVGKRYTVDFVAKDTDTTIAYMSWGHVDLSLAPGAESTMKATELILDDVILTRELTSTAVLGADSVPMMVKTCGINDVIINEASPYATFTINGVEGQKVSLNLQDGTAIAGIDTKGLQYLDPADNTWKAYTPGLQLTLPADGGDAKSKILVRVAITNDAPYEVSEQLTLAATFDNGLVETGTLTILDNGQGSVFLEDNKTPLPNVPTDAGYPTLNNDRGSGPAVNSIIVNEASAYAVFTIDGVAGAGVSLALGAGGSGTTAALSGTNADIGQSLEFWDPTTSSWVAYANGNAKVGADGKLQVRVAVVNDKPLEVSEDFTLTATYNDNGTTTGITVGASSTGQGVIKDDGTGTVFISSATDPGVNNLGEPEIDLDTPKNFDGIQVSDLEINEGSPYGVFTVTSQLPGAKVTLGLRDGTASATAADYVNTLEVWNPTANGGSGAWTAYTGQVLTIPDNGSILVRNPLGNQVPLEGPEKYYLAATLAEDNGIYKAGRSGVGTATILDDASGDWFTGAVTPASSTAPASPTLLPLADTPVVNPADPNAPQMADDDRPLAVNDVVVNEISPYLVFNVTGQQGQYVKLDLSATGDGSTGNNTGHAVLGTDSGTTLEYWNGSAWVAYNPNTYVQLPKFESCAPEGMNETFWKSRAIVSSFHSALYRAESGQYFASGATASPTGENLTIPLLINPANGYNYTGDLIDVAAGGFDGQHALMTTQGLWIWGDWGVLVDKSIVATNNFQKVTLPAELDPTQVKFISGTYGALALVMKDGTVWVNNTRWVSGANQGNGSNNDTTQFLKVLTAPGIPLTGITDLEVHAAGTFAYNRTTNTYYTWGSGSYTGDGRAATELSYATKITPPPLPDGATLEQLQVSGDTDRTGLTYYVLASDGRIYVLGDNSQGQAGQGNLNSLTTWTTVKNIEGSGPLEGVRFISASSNYYDWASASAIREDGSLVSWGANDGSMIATVDKYNTTLPKVPLWLNNDVPPVYIVENGGHFTSVIAVGKDGQIAAAGHNQGGAFGDGTTNDRSAYELHPFASTAGGGLEGACVEVPPGTPVSLLVRVAVKQDTPLEVAETLKLTATNTSGGSAVGIGTIKDDGSGTIFATRADDPNTPADESVPGVNADGTPALDTSTIKDDDRPLTVNDVTVNEASSHIVFTVSGKEGQLFSLESFTGTAELGKDTGTQLQVLTKVCSLQPLTLNVLANDVAATGKTIDPTSVRLFSAASGGSGSTSLSIDGEGTYDVNANGTITFTPTAGLLEGTTLSKVFYSVRDSVENESARAEINLNAGASSTPALTPPAGTTGRYVRVEQSGQYLAMAEVQVFSGTTNIAQGKAASQSSTGWGGVAGRAVDGNTSGNYGNNSVTHTGTSGNEWWEVDLGSAQAIDQIAVWNRSDYSSRLSGATVKILDANRKEVGSFVLAGDASQSQNFSAPPLTGADGQPLDETCAYTWVDYKPGTFVAIPDDEDGTPGEDAKALVRLAVKQDPNYEVSESFTIKATNTGRSSSDTGTGTILDNGQGQIFANPSDDPNTPNNEAADPNGDPVLDTTTPKDDDRPLTVTGSTVKEPGSAGSGYLTFSVSGIEGQPVKLALKDGTGTVGTDTGSGSGSEPLEYWNPTANSGQGAWTAYNPANPPLLPQVGSSANGEPSTLSVRIAVKPDSVSESTEMVTLVATNASGSDFSAPGYILDSSSTTPGVPVVGPNATPIAVKGQTVNEASPYLVYTVSGRVGEGLTLNLAATGSTSGHADPEADISENCSLQLTTLNLLANDAASSGKTLDPATVQLFTAATGGSSLTTLTISGEEPTPSTAPAC